MTGTHSKVRMANDGVDGTQTQTLSQDFPGLFFPSLGDGREKRLFSFLELDNANK